VADTRASDEPVRIAPERLRAFGEDVLRAACVSAEDARIVAWALTEANLEGIDTHGIWRLAIYTRRVRAGLIAARPGLRWSHPAPTVALLDAGNALGAVAATAAVDEAVRLAKVSGVGMVAVAHTNHAAAFSIDVKPAAAAGCAALLVGDTPPAMPPWGGTRAFLGTMTGARVVFHAPLRAARILLTSLQARR
jgi:LDH2 family malate/lactate/ureidoglycolate dehydrogenase